MLKLCNRPYADDNRLRHERSLNMYNRAKFYGPTSKREIGYTDYPTWEEARKETEEQKQ